MRKLFIVLLLFASCFAIAQKQASFSVGSLVTKLNKMADDTNKVKALDSLSYMYANINPDSGIVLAKIALKLADKLDWEKGIAAANAGLGINYRARSDYYRALEYDTKALVIYRRLGDKRSIAAVLSNIAMGYQLQSNYTKALEHHLGALAVMEEVGDKKSQAIILENIGTLYKEQEDYVRTSEYYNAALQINLQINDTAGLARNYGNLGIVYDIQGQYQTALENHKAALEMSKLADNKYSMQVNMANIGIAYLHLQLPEKALEYHLCALKISEALGNKSSIAINMGNIGETYLTIAKTQTDILKNESDAHLVKAVNYLEKAVKICRSIKFFAPTTEFIPYLTEAYALTGNYVKAYEYQKLYSLIKDSIFSIQSKLQIANLESLRKMQLQEKDLQLKDNQIKIAHLKIERKRDEQVLYIISIALLVLVLGITIKSILTYRKSNKLLTSETKLHKDTILRQNVEISNRNKILDEIAHKHSHDLRGHISTILGLSQMFNKDDYMDSINKTVIEGISESTKALDNVIREIVREENELTKSNRRIIR